MRGKLGVGRGTSLAFLLPYVFLASGICSGVSVGLLRRRDLFFSASRPNSRGSHVNVQLPQYFRIFDINMGLLR